MTPLQREQLKKLQERLQLLLSNQLTYPKTVIGVARDRCLTEEEIRKAYDFLEACSKLVGAELTLFVLTADKTI